MPAEIITLPDAPAVTQEAARRIIAAAAAAKEIFFTGSLRRQHSQSVVRTPGRSAVSLANRLVEDRNLFRRRALRPANASRQQLSHGPDGATQQSTDRRIAHSSDS